MVLKKSIVCINLIIVFIILFACSILASEWKLLTEAPRGVPVGWVNQLLVHPSKSNILYAATEGAGFLVSEDGGTTWVPKNQGFTAAEEGTVSGYQIRCIAINPVKPEIIYAGMAAFGVFKSTDGGNSWNDISATLGDTFTKVLTIHPAKPDTVYLGTDGGGIYVYDSKNDEWEEIVNGLKNTYIKAMVIDPKDPNTIYVATDGGIFKTTNGGQSWAQSSNGITTRYTICLAIDPKNPKTLYAGTDGGGLFKTEDGGNNWTAIGGDIWMAKPLTDDLGAPGADMEATPIVSSIVVNPSDTNIVYAANQTGVFRSSDGGKTWSKINEGLTSVVVKSLAVNPAKPVTVYASTSDGKLFAYKEQ